MGARESDAMRRARLLVEAGATPYAAAKETGITQSAITKSKWNRERIAAKNLAPKEPSIYPPELLAQLSKKYR